MARESQESHAPRECMCRLGADRFLLLSADLLGTRGKVERDAGRDAGRTGAGEPGVDTAGPRSRETRRGGVDWPPRPACVRWVRR